MAFTTLYKHRNNTDVAFQIVKSFYVPEKRLYKFTVRWWNIVKSHPPYDMGCQEKLEIPANVWRADWLPYEPLVV